MTTMVSRFQRSVTLLNRLLVAEIMERLGSQITGTQMFMLHFIRDSQRCRLTELAAKLDVKPSAVTVMIDRLVRSGYVNRLQDTVDRRVILVELTAAGVEILAAAQQIREEIVGAYMSRLSVEEGEMATAALEKMVQFAQQNVCKTEN